jgi:dihydrofolate reductase
LIISLLVAADEDGGIGVDNRLPWRLSSDLKKFKELTMGHHMIMGRKTYDSIGRPLPGRTSIVITRNPDFQAEGVLAAHSLAEALEMAQEAGEDEAFVIGGGEIFFQALTVAHRIYLTRVHVMVKADVFFPVLDLEDWEEKHAEFRAPDEKNEFPFTFYILERKVPEP